MAATTAMPSARAGGHRGFRFPLWTPDPIPDYITAGVYSPGQMLMKPTTNNRIDLMFRAFSDRRRLRILYLLQSGECCVGNIVDILGIEQPSASRHLAYLRRAGL